jgi:hypothetical protein
MPPGFFRRDGTIAALTTLLTATGFSKYNATFSYWAACPSPAESAHLTRAPPETASAGAMLSLMANGQRSWCIRATGT